jgi:flavodoxin
MLVQQLKQLHDKLKKLKSQNIISKEDEEEIKRIEKWFEKFYDED